MLVRKAGANLGRSLTMWETFSSAPSSSMLSDSRMFRKRPSNAPVGEVESVLKCRHERRAGGSGTETTDTSGGSAVSGGVCEERYAAKRVLPQSRDELHFQPTVTPGLSINPRTIWTEISFIRVLFLSCGEPRRTLRRPLFGMLIRSPAERGLTSFCRSEI